ncbi:MAG: DUF3108 domain-containing protein [Bacteroidota bacterium]
MILIIAFFLSINLFAQPAKDTKDVTFQMGEELEFKLGYGWFTLGKATANIGEDPVQYSEEECYKVEIVGRTDGFIGLFAHVKDTWGALVAQNQLRPLYAYQDIEEGKYTRKEKTFFDHEEGKIRIIKNDQEKDPKEFEPSKNVHDILSAYLKVRTIDLSKFKKGDTTLVYTYYDNAFYNLVLKHDGKENVKTPFGKIMAHRVLIIIPKNEVFPEEGGVIAWVSADKNQIPLKIEAKMFFGKAFCDLISYKNLRYQSDFVN